MTDESLLKAVAKVIDDHRVLRSVSTIVAQAAIEAYEANQWRPIETAPKDGTMILGLLKAGSLPEVYSWLSAERYCEIQGYDGDDPEDYEAGWAPWDSNETIRDDDACTPKYWRPLPSPPKQELS